MYIKAEGQTIVSSVRICSYVILVTFTVYMCSVNVRSCLNYVAMVVSLLQLRCTERSTAATGVHYEYTLYSGIRASVCPLAVMYMGTPWELTCVIAPPCMYV